MLEDKYDHSVIGGDICAAPGADFPEDRSFHQREQVTSLPSGESATALLLHSDDRHVPPYPVLPATRPPDLQRHVLSHIPKSRVARL